MDTFPNSFITKSLLSLLFPSSPCLISFKGYRVSEEIRGEHLPSSGVSPLKFEVEGEPDLVHDNSFGIGQAAYRM
jgi:hypothetical protein